MAICSCHYPLCPSHRRHGCRVSYWRLYCTHSTHSFTMHPNSSHFFSIRNKAAKMSFAHVLYVIFVECKNPKSVIVRSKSLICLSLLIYLAKLSFGHFAQLCMSMSFPAFSLIKVVNLFILTKLI